MTTTATSVVPPKGFKLDEQKTKTINGKTYEQDSNGNWQEIITKEELDRAFICNEENALQQFKSHMNFNFPDWKIYDKPVVRENGNCIYEIRFTTKNPHYESFGKEVMIVRISFNHDYSRYNFALVRGNIY